MMASYQVTEHFDVHIFDCQADTCAAAIERLKVAFSVTQYRCVAGYKPCGLKKKWFLAHLKASPFTIIHTCDHADDILDCLSQNVELLEKVICVKFKAETSPCAPGRKINYAEFVQRDISTPNKVQNFVTEVACCLQEKADFTASSPAENHYARPTKSGVRSISQEEKRKSTNYVNQDLSGLYSEAGKEFNLNDVIRAQEKEVTHIEQGVPEERYFHPVPNIFGASGGEHEAQVIRQSGTNYESHFNKTPVSELTEEIDRHCPSHSCGESSRHVVHEMLPFMHRNFCLLGLVNVALCDNRSIQQWALTLLEHSCYTDLKGPAEHLREVQNKLILLADKLSNIHEASGMEEQSCLLFVNRVCNLLLLLQANITTACSDQTYANHASLGAVGHIGLTQLSSLSGETLKKTSSKAVKRLQAVWEVLQAACRRGVDKEYLKFKVILQERHIYPKPKEVLKKEAATQVLILVQCLKRIFSTMDRDVTNLTFLREYISVRQRSLRRLGLRGPPKICQELVLRGVTHFMFYSLEKNTEIQRQCQEAFQIIDTTWQEGQINIQVSGAPGISIKISNFVHKRTENIGMVYERNMYLFRTPAMSTHQAGQGSDVYSWQECKTDLLPSNATKWVEPIVSRLLFESVPLIGSQMRELYTKWLNYPSDLPFYLIREVEKQLSPCLIVDKKQKCSDIDSGTWLTFQGRFMDTESVVMVQYHQKTYLNMEPTVCDQQHINQLSHLRDLHHPNIVPLLAFKTRRLPQFYILQSFGNNLQVELAIRRENHQLYDQVTLLSILVQVASALEHCHDRGVIHCDLTAASISVMAGHPPRALLGNFKFAWSGGCRNNRNECHWLSVRHAAPESLRRGFFSKASDAWMMGVLVYEVSTHGFLPYSDLNIDDAELVMRVPFGPPMRRASHHPLTDLLFMQFYPQLNAGRVPSLPEEQCLSKTLQNIIETCCQFLGGDRLTASELKKRLEKELQSQRSMSSGHYQPPSNLGPNRRSSTECTKGFPRPDTKGLRKKYELDLSLSFKRSIRGKIRLYEMDEVLVFRENIVGPPNDPFITDIHGGLLEPLIPPLFFGTLESYANCYFIDCHLPKSEMIGSLFEVCSSKRLGQTFATYIDLLLQWSKQLRVLHDKKYGLADFCAHSLWVRRSAGKYEICPVSFAYLWHRGSADHCMMQKPTDPSVVFRCAPELLNEMKVMEASDFYVFGVLIWQVLHAFFQKDYVDTASGQPQAAGNAQMAMRQCEFSSNFPDCPNKLINLICSCVETQPQFRPKWPEISSILGSTLKQLRGTGCDTFLTAANLSGPGSSSSSSSFNGPSYTASIPNPCKQLATAENALPIANPSDHPDTSSSTETVDSVPKPGKRTTATVRKSFPIANPSDSGAETSTDNSLDENTDLVNKNQTVGFVLNQDLADRLSGIEGLSSSRKALTSELFSIMQNKGSTLKSLSSESELEFLSKKQWNVSGNFNGKGPDSAEYFKFSDFGKPVTESEADNSLSEGSDFETTVKDLMFRHKVTSSGLKGESSVDEASHGAQKSNFYVKSVSSEKWAEELGRLIIQMGDDLDTEVSKTGIDVYLYNKARGVFNNLRYAWLTPSQSVHHGVSAQEHITSVSKEQDTREPALATTSSVYEEDLHNLAPPTFSEQKSGETDLPDTYLMHDDLETSRSPPPLPAQIIKKNHEDTEKQMDAGSLDLPDHTNPIYRHNNDFSLYIAPAKSVTGHIRRQPPLPPPGSDSDPDPPPLLPRRKCSYPLSSSLTRQQRSSSPRPLSPSPDFHRPLPPPPTRDLRSPSPDFHRPLPPPPTRDLRSPSPDFHRPLPPPPTRDLRSSTRLNPILHVRDPPSHPTPLQRPNSPTSLPFSPPIPPPRLPPRLPHNLVKSTDSLCGFFTAGSGKSSDEEFGSDPYKLAVPQLSRENSKRSWQDPLPSLPPRPPLTSHSQWSSKPRQFDNNLYPLSLTEDENIYMSIQSRFVKTSHGLTDSDTPFSSIKRGARHVREPLDTGMKCRAESEEDDYEDIDHLTEGCSQLLSHSDHPCPYSLANEISAVQSFPAPTDSDNLSESIEANQPKPSPSLQELPSVPYSEQRPESSSEFEISEVIIEPSREPDLKLPPPIQTTGTQSYPEHSDRPKDGEGLSMSLSIQGSDPTLHSTSVEPQRVLLTQEPEPVSSIQEVEMTLFDGEPEIHLTTEDPETTLSHQDTQTYMS